MNQQFLSINSNIAQTNKLSPSSIQYLKVLQLNQFDLLAYIGDELLSNPLLEESSESSLSSDELDSFLQSMSSAYGSPMKTSSQNPVENTLQSSESLYDHLICQLSILSISPRELRTSKVIVNSLNSSGYLDSSLKELSLTFNIDSEELSACLAIVQSLEPAGVGATSLAECLALQLDRDDDDFLALSSIISNHLDLVASNKLQTLSKSMKLPIDQINSLIKKISTLDPKPGLAYGGDINVATEYTIPEIFLSVKDGDIDVLIPDSLFPSLRVNSYYRDLLSRDYSQESKDFLTKNLNRAIMLIKNLEQRKKTVKAIVEEIIFYQKSFFLDGSNLKPLNLSQIAKNIDMHESTVSRAIKGKYLHCDSGVFPLKHFFSNKSLTSSSDDKGNLDIKNILSQIIASEDPYKPYSDSDLSKLLLAKGISVARRTVTKYRESLDIKSSRLRRKYK